MIASHWATSTLPTQGGQGDAILFFENCINHALSKHCLPHVGLLFVDQKATPLAMCYSPNRRITSVSAAGSITARFALYFKTLSLLVCFNGNFLYSFSTNVHIALNQNYMVRLNKGAKLKYGQKSIIALLYFEV